MGFQEGALPIKYLGVPLVSTKAFVADCRPLLQQIDARLAVIREIEGRMRRFLWRGSSMNGYAKVSWDQVCKSKQEGGLGIQRVLHLNQALLCKQVWRLLQEDRSIWVEWVLRHRLQKQSLWTSKTTTAPWCWKQMIKISHLLKPGLDYRVGDGSKFKLWLDVWHEKGPLIHHYPRGPLATGLPSRFITYRSAAAWVLELAVGDRL
ncbi:UNVERIFIED_CONTAM: hypothetical protein Sradi_6854600 [Sesamum radiatum]|uniref:Uncharacterized protein n=1 Tax=Sesamum radiatum TaxID=300843 RepID=A0AAW2JKX7_SESRA